MDVPLQRNRRWKSIRNGLGVVTVIVLIAAATFGFSRIKEAPPTINEDLLWIGTAQRGEFIRQVRGNGVLVPKVEWWLSAPGAGQVSRIHVEPGQRVAKGDPIVSLTNPILEQEVQDAKWKLQAAEAELKNQTAQLESQELDRKDAIVTLEAQLKVASMEAARDAELFKEGLLGKHQMDTSAAKEEELNTRLQLAQERLKTVKESTAASLAVQESTVEQLNGLVALKERQLQDLVVASREAGIMKQLLVEVGQQVTSATTLAHMAEPNELMAELNVPETQIKDIQLGQYVQVDTRNGYIDGEVKRIDPAVLEGTVKVEVALTSELPNSARPDLSVEGRIELDRRSDVLFIERPTISRENADIEMFCIAREDNLATKRRIRLGRSSVNTIEVLEGLAPGEQVILSDMTKYQGDDRIRLR